MSFYLLGANYRTLTFELQEELSRQHREIQDFWNSRLPWEAAVLFTCNRVEIYIAGSSGRIKDDLIEFRQRFARFFATGYLLLGERALLRHGLRLASGLDSQLRGESQIFEQLRIWSAPQNFPPALLRLWEEILSGSRMIRSQSGLDRQEINIARIVLRDLAEQPEFLGAREMVIIGTGKVAELFVKTAGQKWRLNFVANKHYAKAQALAEASQGFAYRLADLPQLLASADVLISATASPHYVILPELFSGLNGLRSRPLYIYDLALPRDVQPEVSNLPGVCLKNLNDLTEIINREDWLHQEAFGQAEQLIEEILNEKSQIRQPAQPVGEYSG